MDGDLTDRDDMSDMLESDLTETAHAECLVLYQESTTTIRYAKSQQWKTLLYLIGVYAALLMITYTRLIPPDLVPMIIIMAFVLCAFGVSVLVIFQMWQSTEHRKLDHIADHMSDVFRETRALKSRIEADIQRYAILAFMVLFILTATAITYMILARYLPQ